LKLRLATQWGCSINEVERRLPASELPLWHAWQYIEPMGWQALDFQFARLARRLSHGENLPELSAFLTPERDWREFDPDLWAELEADRECKKMESILRPDIRK